MVKFKVGDRVAAYNSHGRFCFQIPFIDPGGYLPYLEGGCSFHPKQCRKLKPKKERRVIWVNYYVGGSSYIHATKETADQPGGSPLECVRFREWPEKSS